MTKLSDDGLCRPFVSQMPVPLTPFPGGGSTVTSLRIGCCFTPFSRRKPWTPSCRPASWCQIGHSLNQLPFWRLAFGPERTPACLGSSRRERQRLHHPLGLCSPALASREACHEFKS